MSDPDEGDERADRAGAEDGDRASGDPGAESGDDTGDEGSRSDRAGDLQSVVDREVEEIQGKMAEIRDRMEAVGDELDERWTTDPDRTPDGPTDPDEIVERLEKWKTSADGEPGTTEDSPGTPVGHDEGSGAAEDGSGAGDEGSGEAAEPPDERGEDGSDSGE